jgi:hypothetical protein
MTAAMTQRRRFQLTLRTSIVLMLVAGVFVGVNVVSRTLWKADKTEVMVMGDDVVRTWKGRGWPMTYLNFFETTGESRYVWNYWALAWNVVVPLGILAGMWIVLERPWRKPSQSPPATSPGNDEAK